MSNGIIFIIDDEKILRDLLVDLLTNEGYEVHAFENGKKALSEAKLRIENKLEIDLVLSDVNMPIMSGIKLVEELRNLSFKNSFLLFSGESGEALIKLKKIPGVTDVVSKPYKSKILLEKISSYIHKRSLNTNRPLS
jgi:CheY-like chemotaxis protein